MFLHHRTVGAIFLYRALFTLKIIITIIMYSLFVSYSIWVSHPFLIETKRNEGEHRVAIPSCNYCRLDCLSYLEADPNPSCQSELAENLYGPPLTRRQGQTRHGSRCGAVG
jgi:hypothetical protein